jgi:T4 RnlA family RNA ligase
MKNGYKLSSFNYFICGWDDFAKPLPSKPHINAFDMRGVTFVFNKDGSLHERFLMLPKFFNINQVESTQYGNVKDKKIKSITTKEDGSLIAVMRLPDNTLFAKTIGSFDNEQIEAAMKFLKDNHIYELFCRVQLDAGYTPLFEYVSWDNRIVLKYSKPELRLIGARNNKTGEFHTSADFDCIDANIIIAENFKNLSLDELIEKAKTEENKEGWVVMFEDGQLIKIKTEWYFNLHGLRTMNVFREDYIIANYLGQTLDDIMSQLDPAEDNDAFIFVETVTDAINNYINHIDECTKSLKEKFVNEYRSEWRYFAKFCNKEPYFGLSRTLIETPEEYRRRRNEMIIKNAFRLKGAKNIVDRWKTK